MAREGWRVANSPDPAGFYRVHRLTLSAVEGFAELIEVLNGAVCPPPARRVGIGERKLASGLFGLVLAPNLGESDEVTLRLGVAINLFVDGLALGGQRVEQGHISYAKAAVVRGILAQRQFPIEFL